MSAPAPAMPAEPEVSGENDPAAGPQTSNGLMSGETETGKKRLEKGGTGKRGQDRAVFQEAATQLLTPGQQDTMSTIFVERMVRKGKQTHHSLKRMAEIDPESLADLRNKHGPMIRSRSPTSYLELTGTDMILFPRLLVQKGVPIISLPHFSVSQPPQKKGAPPKVRVRASRSSVTGGRTRKSVLNAGIFWTKNETVIGVDDFSDFV